MQNRARPRKPRNPWPLLVRRLLVRLLPHSVYRRYIGRHEDTSLAIWRRLARSIAPHTAILDIGAFHGEFSLAAKEQNPAAEVVAFEPDPSNLTTLRRACDLRGIRIVAAAVCDRGGVVQFVADLAQGHIADAAGGSAPAAGVHEVPAVALDAWASESGLVPSLIKIDVEGAETSILRGARRTLAECAPIILCEVLSDEAGRSVMTALPEGYRYWHIDENHGLTEAPLISRRLWRNKNWLLVPDAKNALVRALVREV